MRVEEENTPFEDYLKKRALRNKFNNSDIETFSWYLKVLGLSKDKKEV